MQKCKKDQLDNKNRIFVLCNNNNINNLNDELLRFSYK